MSGADPWRVFSVQHDPGPAPVVGLIVCAPAMAGAISEVTSPGLTVGDVDGEREEGVPEIPPHLLGINVCFVEAGPTSPAGLVARHLLWIRLARKLGARWIVLVGEAAALRAPFEAGDVVFVTDHIQWMGDNPLIGPNDDNVGPRFPDMSSAYSDRLRGLGAATAGAASVREGVLVGIPDPRAVTPAEARMLGIAGGDFVAAGMVPAAIVAVHAGLEVMGIAAITSAAATPAFPALDDGAIERTREAARSKIRAILNEFLRGALA